VVDRRQEKHVARFDESFAHVVDLGFHRDRFNPVGKVAGLKRHLHGTMIGSVETAHGGSLAAAWQC